MKYLFISIFVFLIIILWGGGKTYKTGLNCTYEREDYFFLVNNSQCIPFKNNNVTLITDSNNFITAPFTKEKYNVEILRSDIVSPFSLNFLPNGTFLITEKRGNLIINGNKINFNYNKSRRIFGLAVDPEFSENRYIYIFNLYNASEKYFNRIIRFRLLDNKIIENKIIFDGIEYGKYHNGGRIRFGSDGKLYIGTGDSDKPEISQNIDKINGAILRINKDGSIPPDNPFGNAIYSYGHRNPQGFDWHPETGKLYATEHGHQRMDEINIIEKGKNYGWPNFHCDIKKNDATENTEPVFCFYSEEYEGKSNYYTVAPSGGSFVTDPQHPWYGSFFFGTLRGGHLHRLILDENGSVIKNEIFLAGFGRIRDVAFNEKDGGLYVITSNSDVIKYVPEGNRYKNVRDKLIKLTPVDNYFLYK